MPTLKSRLAGITCIALLFAGGVALAKPVEIIPGDPPITADIPASWKVTEIKRGIQAKTADDEVYIWFESYRPAQFKKVLEEHNAYYEEQGVKINGEPKATEKEYPKYFLKYSEYPATYEDGPTVLRYISVVPKNAEARHLILSYWASPEGDKEYDAEIQKIMNSLGASFDAM